MANARKVSIWKKICWRTDLVLDTVGHEFDQFKLFVWGIFAPKFVTEYYNRWRNIRDMMDELDEQYACDIDERDELIAKLQSELAMYRAQEDDNK